MEKPAPIHLNKMYRVIRYVLETKTYGLKFYPKDVHGSFKHSVTVILLQTGKQEEVFMDILYTFVVYLLYGKRKAMRSVLLSTTEAKYTALLEVVKEIKFIIQLMSTMNMNDETPITIYVDNVGAI